MYSWWLPPTKLHWRFTICNTYGTYYSIALDTECYSIWFPALSGLCRKLFLGLVVHG